MTKINLTLETDEQKNNEIIAENGEFKIKVKYNSSKIDTEKDDEILQMAFDSIYRCYLFTTGRRGSDKKQSYKLEKNIKLKTIAITQGGQNELQ